MKSKIKIKILRKQFRFTSGIFLPKEVLSKTKIDADEIELEFHDYDFRIQALIMKTKKKIFNSDAPLWKCTGFAQSEGINGRDHDQFIYDEK